MYKFFIYVIFIFTSFFFYLNGKFNFKIYPNMYLRAELNAQKKSLTANFQNI